MGSPGEGSKQGLLRPKNNIPRDKGTRQGHNLMELSEGKNSGGGTTKKGGGGRAWR